MKLPVENGTNFFMPIHINWIFRFWSTNKFLNSNVKSATPMNTKYILSVSVAVSALSGQCAFSVLCLSDAGLHGYPIIEKNDSCAIFYSQREERNHGYTNSGRQN